MQGWTPKVFVSQNKNIIQIHWTELPNTGNIAGSCPRNPSLGKLPSPKTKRSAVGVSIFKMNKQLHNLLAQTTAGLSGQYLSCGLGITLGLLGGLLFSVFGLPLPWVLGSLLATGTAAYLGVKLLIFEPLRLAMLIVLGCTLGTRFSPDVLERCSHWLPTLAALLTFSILATLLVSWYLRKYAGFDSVTAYFASTPGGLAVMGIIGGSLGGDIKQIALAHTIRILYVVFSLGFAFRFFTSADTTGISFSQGDGSPLHTDPIGTTFLAAGIVAAIGASKILRLPSPVLIGAMIGSAGMHVSGICELQLPAGLVIGAQVILGVYLGSRFSDISREELLKSARVSTWSTLLLLVIAGCFSVMLSFLLEIPFTTLMLAFSPGGLVEMCLIGIALGADVAFISTHHLIRIIAITAFAPVAFRLFTKQARQREP